MQIATEQAVFVVKKHHYPRAECFHCKVYRFRAAPIDQSIPRNEEMIQAAM